jgi:hypothetical protein
LEIKNLNYKYKRLQQLATCCEGDGNTGDCPILCELSE